MMPMLRISDRAVVRGIADFHDSFRVTSERPIRAVAAGLLGSAAAVNSFVLLLVSRALAIPRACHVLAALGPSPGSKGRRRAATYDSNKLPISRALGP